MALLDVTGGFSKAAEDFAGMAGDILVAGGLRSERDAYYKAEGYANQNAQIETASTAIRAAQSQREVYKITGGQRADVAGAGLAASGSALDIMRDSAHQGVLENTLIDEQGQINVNAYHQQASSFEGQAQSAEASAQAHLAAATGKAVSGAAHTVSGILSVLSLGLFG